jgi:hypothetical protein
LQHNEKKLLSKAETSQVRIQQVDQFAVKEDEEKKILKRRDLQEPQHLPLLEQHQPLFEDHDGAEYHLGQELLTQVRDQQGEGGELLFKSKNLERLEVEQENGPSNLSLGPAEGVCEHLQQALYRLRHRRESVTRPGLLHHKHQDYDRSTDARLGDALAYVG